MGRASRVPLSLAIAVAVVCGCALGSDAGAEPRGATRMPAVSQLPGAISPARLHAHLVAFQRIADRNGRTRAAGTAGYAASVRYVRDALRRAGYAPRVSPFPFVEYRELVERGRQISPRSRPLRVEAIDYSPSTPAAGLRARVVPSGDGCDASDFRGVRGRIALAQRGTCFIFVKAQNAARAGAAALVVYTTEPGPIDATLGDPNASTIPVVAIKASVASSLGRGAILSLRVTTRKRASTSQNVLADTRPGARRVLLVGAHLDSVVAGPGINDNATGVAALLEIARRVRTVEPRLAVRFAFWGAEELGLIGSRAYAGTVPAQGLAGYLNFDMLGSRERLRGVYAGPYAARWLRYFRQKRLRAEVVDLAGRSDHAPFQERGVPTGGLFAGGDACYHEACDRLARVDRRLFEELARAAAFGVAAFAPTS